MFTRQTYCLLLAVLTVFLVISPAYSAQSTITEAEGYSCMGEDKSRKQTKREALIEAKRKAIEHTITYIKSETQVKDFQLEKDIVAAYSRADVKVLEMKELGWYKDEYSGECFKVLIKVEVIPDDKGMERLSNEKQITDDPLAPLNVQVWADKKEYKNGERVKLYIKGNKPFYARLVYKVANGKLVQLLPNPYRSDNYFNGGVIYELPSGKDSFELRVSPPFGMENITLYGSSSQLGDIELEAAGGIYEIKTGAEDIGNKSRGVVVKDKGMGKPQKILAEFSEVNMVVNTVEK